jgi:Flp pilus assembly protein TadG
MTRTSTPHRARGSVAVEYGLILPPLLFMVLGIMDVGRLLWTYTTLYRASEAAARCGAIASAACATASSTQSYAVTQAYGLTVTTAAFAVGTAGCGVQVTATLPFTFVIPKFFDSTLGTITLSTTACYPT